MGAHRHDEEHRHRRGAWSALGHLFGGHSHATGSDRALTGTQEGIRAVKISLAILSATALLQAVVVLLSGSVALLSDTLHNFTDALTALPLWLAFRLARRPATRRYTYGYGRAEDVAGLFIVLVIFASAGFAAAQAFDRLLNPQELRQLPLVVVASIIGFAGNELVASYRIRVGRRIGSAALVADGLHARVDGLTSLAVLIAAIGVALGFPLADPIAGLVVSAAIMGVLAGAAKDVYHRLMDAVDPQLVGAIEEALEKVDGVRAVTDVRVRWIGHELRADVQIEIEGRLDISQGHRIAVRAHHALLHDVPNLGSALVHVHPYDGDADAHTELAHHGADSPLMRAMRDVPVPRDKAGL